MKRQLTSVLIVGAVLASNLASAHEGPCSNEIAQLEQVVRLSKRNGDAAQTGPQSIGAQLHHQPTPSSVKQAEDMAQTNFATILSRAKTLDAEGKRAECMEALTAAKLMFDSQ
jgi:hypothetical protein